MADEQKPVDVQTLLAYEAGQESLLADDATLTVNILRRWDRARIERFALHLLGDAHQNLVAVAEEWRTAQLAAEAYWQSPKPWTPAETPAAHEAVYTRQENAVAALQSTVDELRRARGEAEKGGEGD